MPDRSGVRQCQAQVAFLESSRSTRQRRIILPIITPSAQKWSIAQNLAHLNFGYPYLDTIASSIAAARAKGIIGNGPFRYGWLSSWIMNSQEPPPKRKFKAAKVNTPLPDVDPAKALADYLRMGARVTELIQKADGLDLARAKTPFGVLKWAIMPWAPAWRT